MIDIEGLVQKEIAEAAMVFRLCEQNQAFAESIARAIELAIPVARAGKLLAFAGNGGSHTTAEHTVADLGGHFRGLSIYVPAVVLGSGLGSVTAIGNDYSFEEIFAHHLRVFEHQIGLVTLVSTSGKSQNILQAAKLAKASNIPVVVWTSTQQSGMLDFADVLIAAPTELTHRAQEVHDLVMHIFCYLLRLALAESG